MDLEIRIIQHDDFLRTTSTGEIDLEQSKQLLLKLASLNKPPSSRDVLLDLRTTTGHLTITDVTELVELMMQHRDSFRRKLAILIPPRAPVKLAEFMEVYAFNRGFRAAAFDDFEAAVLWLATTIEVL